MCDQVFQFAGFYRASISIRVDVQPSTQKDSFILSLSTGLRSYLLFFFSFRSYYHPLILPRNSNKLVERSTPPFFFSIRSQESSYQPFTPYQFENSPHCSPYMP